MQGRKSKYPISELYSLLNDYIEKHPREKISYKVLVIETGIPRHVWNYNCKEFIDAHNKRQEAIMAKGPYIEFPSAKELLQQYEKNPAMVEKQVQLFIDVAATLNRYKDKNEDENEEKQKLIEDNERMELLLKKEKEKNKQLMDIVNLYAVNSQFDSFRKEFDIDNSFLDLTEENMNTFIEAKDILENL